MRAWLRISSSPTTCPTQSGSRTTTPNALPAIFATIAKHGGAIVGAGPTNALKGSAAQTCVCLTFPSDDAAKAWLDDDEYAPLKAIRYESTTNISEYLVPALPGADG